MVIILQVWFIWENFWEPSCARFLWLRKYSYVYQICCPMPSFKNLGLHKAYDSIRVKAIIVEQNVICWETTNHSYLRMEFCCCLTWVWKAIGDNTCEGQRLSQLGYRWIEDNHIVRFLVEYAHSRVQITAAIYLQRYRRQHYYVVGNVSSSILRSVCHVL